MEVEPATELLPTPPVSCSLKRKRPPMIEIPTVLQEIQSDKLKFKEFTPKDEPCCSSGIGVGVSSTKGNKKFMEDTHKIVSCLNGSPKRGFFGVYDGHGGHKAAEFVAENLHTNILEMMANCSGHVSKEEAVKAGYLKTDQEFLKQGLVSGACCVTALIENQEVVVSNLGDCRAVLCRGGVAEALTKDHRPECEDERKRIENKGGYVEIHRGAWRVHGVLSVSRSIGDAHLKAWVPAEPDTVILQLTPDMEFLVLASDGLWELVGNQEAIDTVIRLCMPEKKLSSIPKDDDVRHGNVNASPSSKLRRVSLLKQQKKLKNHSPSSDRKITNNFPSENESPNLLKEVCLVKQQKGPKSLRSNKSTVCSWKEDDFPSENESRPSKSRRISIVKRVNLVKTDSPVKENVGSHGCRLVAACKELVNLAVSRGSLDDITVMIVDLNHFRCNT